LLRWLVAYNASRRRREIGIRMALGAGSSDVLRLVGMGTAIGLAMPGESILLAACVPARRAARIAPHGAAVRVAQLLREQLPWTMEQYDRSYR
jgi:hypothetical protein